MRVMNFQSSGASSLSWRSTPKMGDDFDDDVCFGLYLFFHRNCNATFLTQL